MDTLIQQLTKNHAESSEYMPDNSPSFSVPPVVRLIAFYLPQFHAIKENDEWWGKGFTEWTNVTKAIPRFKGHYQPHLPGELGFYDLTSPEVLRKQAALAKRYGLGGFCFHHYWFNRRRLLETPLNLWLQHKDIDLPFCINWANENWTRRWDGAEKDVLLQQNYSDEDDIDFIASLEPAMRDHRYIRIDGRPLLMLYRPGILPDAVETVRRWRDHCERNGLGNPYIVMAQAFGDFDPTKYGMDAAVEFPPHKVGFDLPEVPVETFDGERYRGRTISYDAMINRFTTQPKCDYHVMPGVTLGWDNEARKPQKGTTVVGCTPLKYSVWLESACRKAMLSESAAERVVFINAWNEWAEGTHLEPDRHYGYAFLYQTSKVLINLSEGLTNRIANDQNKDLFNLPSSQQKTNLFGKVIKKQIRRCAERLLIIAEWLIWKLR